MARRYVVQKIARTDTTIFKLERHRVRGRGRLAAASVQEPVGLKVGICLVELVHEADSQLAAGLIGQVGLCDDASNKLEMLTGQSQCPLLCSGHLNYRYGWGRVKNYLTFLKSWVR